MSQKKALIPNFYYLRRLFLEICVKYENNNISKLTLFNKISPHYRKLLATEFAMKEDTISKLAGAPLKGVRNQGLGITSLNKFVKYISNGNDKLDNWESYIKYYAIPDRIQDFVIEHNITNDYNFHLPKELIELVDSILLKELFPEPYTSKNFENSRMPFVDAAVTGRDVELKKIISFIEDNETRIISITGKMGMGKSSMAQYILHNVKQYKAKRFETVFCWSFNFQNSNSSSAESEIFINEALSFYGIKSDSTSSIESKVKLLSRFLENEEHLLVLDGIEALEFNNEFELIDSSLKLLIRLLLDFGKSKLLLTSRIPLQATFLNYSNFKEVELKALSINNAVKVLQSFYLKGEKEDFKNVAKKLSGHPFTIRYFAKRILKDHSGSLKKNLLSYADFVELDSSFGKEFSINFKKIKEQKHLLLLICCFYEQINFTDLIKVLKYFNDETDSDLSKLSDITLKLYLQDLDDQGLIIFNKSRVYCFPIVSNYCINYMKTNNQELWNLYNTNIYNFYKDSDALDFKSEVEYIEKLFLSLKHACNAGLYEKSVVEVMYPKISREKEMYSFKVLGLVAPEVMALKNYFEIPFRKIKDGVVDYIASYLFNAVGFKFSALAKINEAIEPTLAAAELSVKLDENKNASSNYNNLSEFSLYLGRLEKSKKYNQLAIDYLDKLLVKKDERTEMSDQNIAQLRSIRQFQKARTLYYLDELIAFKSFYEIAENFVDRKDSSVPVMRSETSFYYAQYCFKNGENNLALKVLEDSLNNYSLKKNIIFSVAFDYLGIAQFCILENDLKEAYTKVKESLLYFNKSKIIQFLPYVYIVKADIEIKLKKYEQAEKTLESCREIIFDDLILFQISYYAILSNLSKELGKTSEAQKCRGLQLKLMTDYGFEDYFHSFSIEK